MSGGELRRGGGAVRVTILLGPAEPTGGRAQGRAKISIQRIEARMRLQQGVPRRRERAEFHRPFGPRVQMAIAEIAKQHFQYFEFQLRDAVIIDQRHRAQFGQASRETSPRRGDCAPACAVGEFRPPRAPRYTGH